jgi:hypothetical protein
MKFKTCRVYLLRNGKKCCVLSYSGGEKYLVRINESINYTHIQPVEAYEGHECIYGNQYDIVAYKDTPNQAAAIRKVIKEEVKDWDWKLVTVYAIVIDGKEIEIPEELYNELQKAMEDM